MAADQKVSNVEKLVDDLCEKLREIEGQQNSVDDSQFTDSTEIETMKRVSVYILLVNSIPTIKHSHIIDRRSYIFLLFSYTFI